MKRMFNSNKVWYDIQQSSQLYQNCIMLAQFAVSCWHRRLRDRMHRVEVEIVYFKQKIIIGKERLFLLVRHLSLLVANFN